MSIARGLRHVEISERLHTLIKTEAARAGKPMYQIVEEFLSEKLKVYKNKNGEWVPSEDRQQELATAERAAAEAKKKIIRGLEEQVEGRLEPYIRQYEQMLEMVKRKTFKGKPVPREEYIRHFENRVRVELGLAELEAITGEGDIRD